MKPLAQYVYNYFGREAVQSLLDDMQSSECPGTVLGKFLERAGFQLNYAPRCVSSDKVVAWFVRGDLKLSYQETKDKDVSLHLDYGDPANVLYVLGFALREMGLLEIDEVMTGAEAQDAQQLDADSVLGPTIGYDPIYE